MYCASIKKAPEITRTRLYIETMEEVLANTNKIVIDQEGGNNMMYLPLDQILKNSQRSNVTQQTVGESTSNVDNTGSRTTTTRRGR